MSKHALVVKADLTAELIDIAEQELSKLQAVVDGLIEAVQVNEDITMWVNEEGLFRSDLDTNYLASVILAVLSGGRQPLIKGNIVFTGSADDNGETKGLQQGDVDQITSMVKRATEALNH